MRAHPLRTRQSEGARSAAVGVRFQGVPLYWYVRYSSWGEKRIGIQIVKQKVEIGLRRKKKKKAKKEKKQKDIKDTNKENRWSLVRFLFFCVSSPLAPGWPLLCSILSSLLLRATQSTASARAAGSAGSDWPRRQTRRKKGVCWYEQW